MSSKHTLTLIVTDGLTDRYLHTNPDAPQKMFMNLRDSNLAMEVGNDGETPTFEILEFVSLEPVPTPRRIQ